MEPSPGNTGSERRGLIIAIDGPSASGKSTVGRMVASRLGYLYIDTGALYRAVAWIAARAGITAEDPSGLNDLIEKAEIGLPGEGGATRVTVDGRDISDEIRSEELGRLASDLSALPGVRSALLGIQKRLGGPGGVVMDGRDIGTVVFPEAEVKVFLSASDEERARRRWMELRDKGVETSLEGVLKDLRSRDASDLTRAHAPLRAAPDAVVVDSTTAGAGQVAGHIIEIARSRMDSPGERPAGAVAASPTKKKLKIAVLHRRLDHRFKDNFPKDVEGREDESYLLEILTALRKKGHEAFPFTVREDALQDLQHLDCDLAFNLVEEGLNNSSAMEPHLPALLDIFGIPYTGGDFLSIALTADKARTKEVLTFHRIPTPAFQLFESPADEIRADLRFPLIVKPVREDAGIGIFLDSVVRSERTLKNRVRKVLRSYKQPALAEEYIHGREISVAVFEHRGRLHVSPLSEVVFYTDPGKPRVYTYTAKWDDESDEFDYVDPTVCPAEEIDPALEEQIRELAVRTFRALRLRGYGRIDFRLSGENRLYVFEVNVNPLIGEESLMAVLARNMGWFFPAFINNIAMEAYRRSLREKRCVTLRDLQPRPSGPAGEGDGGTGPS